MATMHTTTTEHATATRHRAGITIDPEQRRNEWARRYPNMSNWQEEGPFLSRAAAKRWQDAQVGYDKSRGDRDPKHPFVLWYGYRFDY